MDTTKQQQTSPWEKFVEIIEEEKKQQNEEKANNDCIGEECDGHCNADDVEECDDCGIKLRIGSECDPSDHSIFNGMCDDCREVEAITRQIDEYVKEHPEADIGKFN